MAGIASPRPQYSTGHGATVDTWARPLRTPAMLIALACLTGAVYVAVFADGFVYEDAAWRVRMGADWHPLGNLSLWSFNLQTWLGSKARGFHAGNLALHVLNGLLVFVIARRVIAAKLAAVAAFIFLLHPIQREAVHYISGRPDLLSTCCVLLGLAYVPLALKRPLWSVAILACSVCACLAKPSAISVVGLLVMSLAVLSQREQLARVIGWGILALVTGALLLAPPIALSAFLRTSNLDLVEYMGRQAAACWRLLALVIVPRGFSIDHDYAWVTLSCGLLAFAALGLIVRWSSSHRMTQPVLAWAGLWIVIAMAPRFLALGAYANALPPEITERQFYIAMPGVSIGLAALLKGVL